MTALIYRKCLLPFAAPQAGWTAEPGDAVGKYVHGRPGKGRNTCSLTIRYRCAAELCGRGGEIVGRARPIEGTARLELSRRAARPSVPPRQSGWQSDISLRGALRVLGGGGVVRRGRLVDRMARLDPDVDRMARLDPDVDRTARLDPDVDRTARLDP